MKAVEFSLRADNKKHLIDMTIQLKTLCSEKGLFLTEGRYLYSLREYNSCNGGVKYDYILHIRKDKEHTYNEIYELVNSVQVTSYKTVDIR
jgi:hypothetical protein